MFGKRQLRLPQAIGFDFDHTLGIDNKLERVALLHVGRRVADAGGKEPANLTAETAAIDALLLAQRSGACTIDDAVSKFVRERGLTETAPFVEWFREFCLRNVRSFIVPLPGVRDLLTDLQQRRIPCAILTNGWSPLQEAKAESIGFDGPVLVSSVIGTSKPSREAFARLCRALTRWPTFWERRMLG
jgi:FMN phosphatase YigB (HAD superfamily)